jgi:antirestriction protein ArdC
MRSGRPGNYFTKRKYNGINWLSLGLSATESPWFLTFKQANELGWKIRKGEKGQPVVFWNFMFFDSKDSSRKLSAEAYSSLDSSSKGSFKKVPFLTYSTVFNLSQVEGDGVAEALAEFVDKASFSYEQIDAVVAACGVPVVNSGERNFGVYFSEIDEIHMPHKWQYDEPARYYKTVLHELAHSTGTPNRLNRKSLTEYETQRPYEELVAELAAAFLCQEFGLSTDQLFDNSAAYLKSWISHLENDHTFIFRAASDAMKAVDYILKPPVRQSALTNAPEEEMGGLPV